MSDKKKLDPLRDPAVADCVRNIYHESVNLKKSIDWLVETVQNGSYIEDHQLLASGYFNSLLSDYLRLIDEHSKREKVAEDKMTGVFEVWVQTLELPSLKHGEEFRKRFLEYFFNQGDKHLLSITSLVLAEGQFTTDNYWVKTGWEKTKRDMQKLFLERVTDEPRLNKHKDSVFEGAYLFPATGIQAKEGKDPSGLKTLFCYSIKDKKWKPWHEIKLERKPW